METVKRIQRLFRTGVVIAVLMLIVAGTLVTFRESQYDRLQEEYAAAREAAILLEQYVENGVLPDLPSSVSGFGLYNLDGTAIVSSGTAPPRIPVAMEPHELRRIDGRLRLIRPVGAPRGAPIVRGEPGGETAPRGMRRMPGPVGQFVLVDYDVEAQIRGQAWERAALIASGILTAAVLAMIVVLYRRLQFASREAEDQRRLAQLGEAARTLAHEIKNPLTAAQMQTALLRRTTEKSEHRRIDVIDEELKRIRVLTDQVREFLKSGVGKPEALRVLPLVRDLAERLSIPVELHGDDATVVRFDRERFQSVVGNLLRNAREADETGAPVRVEVHEQRSRVRLLVSDRGPGIPQAERDRVFDPFFTTKTHGSGVGLAVTRRFVEDAGGDISIEDRGGGGTTVVLNLRRVA